MIHSFRLNDLNVYKTELFNLPDETLKINSYVLLHQ